MGLSHDMERNVISIRFTSFRSCPNNKGHVTERTKLARHVFIHERHQAHSPLRNLRLRNFNILEHQLWIVGEKPSKSFTAYSLVTVQAKRFTLFARRVELGQGRHCACRLHTHPLIDAERSSVKTTIGDNTIRSYFHFLSSSTEASFNSLCK